MKMEKKFEFKKISSDKYAFTMKSDDIERTEIVNKAFAKSHYEDISHQKVELLNNLSKANKDLEANKVEYDAELERFINLANNAAKYKKYMDATANHRSILDMIENINKSMDSMEKIIPELKRGVKK
jgi:hypothetical protein